MQNMAFKRDSKRKIEGKQTTHSTGHRFNQVVLLFAPYNKERDTFSINVNF